LFGGLELAALLSITIISIISGVISGGTSGVPSASAQPAPSRPPPVIDPREPASPPVPPRVIDPRGPASPPVPSEAPLPSCLDLTIKDQLGADLKPRGVQKRNFAKNKKIVLVAHGGLFGGDLTSSSWITGGSLGLFFTEDLGFNVEIDLTPLTLDLDAPLNKFFGDNRFAPGMAYVGLANLLWSPIHAKLKMGGGIVHSDILVFAGGGRMIHDAVQGLSFDAGSALDLFVTRALMIRLDVRDLMAVEEISGETRYTNNLVATAGLALYFPSGL
jgi:outer membrane beta-barrel protein